MYGQTWDGNNPFYFLSLEEDSEQDALLASANGILDRTANEER
jgi:hypothetical protein